MLKEPKNVVLLGWFPGHLSTHMGQLLQLNDINVIASCCPESLKKHNLKRFEVPEAFIEGASCISTAPAMFQGFLAGLRGACRNYVTHELLSISGYKGFRGADMVLYGLKPKGLEGHCGVALARLCRVPDYNVLIPGVFGNIITRLRYGFIKDTPDTYTYVLETQ